jgi:hypothetical protein
MEMVQANEKEGADQETGVFFGVMEIVSYVIR